MKKTQMIHSPRTFKIGLGLMLAASLASMPVLTGASERQEAKAAAATKKLDEVEKQGAKSKPKSQPQQVTAAAKRRNSTKAEEGKSKSRSASAEDRSKQRRAKFEIEAKKIADQLSPSQRTKLLTFINDSKSDELAAIRGVGKSRSAAIEKARPIESIEDLPKVKGVGLKTLAEVVDHGRGVTAEEKAAPKPRSTKSDSQASPDEEATARAEPSAKKA
jgi:DNA uptake protein ComE-like DNA-binding protein